MVTLPAFLLKLCLLCFQRDWMSAWMLVPDSVIVQIWKVVTFQNLEIAWTQAFVNVHVIRLTVTTALITRASDRWSDDRGHSHMSTVVFRCRSQAGRTPDLGWWLAVGSWFTRLRGPYVWTNLPLWITLPHCSYWWHDHVHDNGPPLLLVGCCGWCGLSFWLAVSGRSLPRTDLGIVGRWFGTLLRTFVGQGFCPWDVPTKTVWCLWDSGTRPHNAHGKF